MNWDLILKIRWKTVIFVNFFLQFYKTKNSYSHKIKKIKYVEKRLRKIYFHPKKIWKKYRETFFSQTNWDIIIIILTFLQLWFYIDNYHLRRFHIMMENLKKYFFLQRYIYGIFDLKIILCIVYPMFLNYPNLSILLLNLIWLFRTSSVHHTYNQIMSIYRSNNFCLSSFRMYINLSSIVLNL